MNPLLAKVLGALLACALAFGAGWTANGWRLGADMARAEAQTANATLDAERRAREKEQEHAQQLADIEAKAKTANDRAAAAGRRADAAAASLREPAYRAGQAACDSAAASAGQATGPADVVPGELYRWADDRAGELAKAFDAARTAGLACQEAYDVVRGP